MPICPICGDENPRLGAKCPRDEGYFIYEDAVRKAETDDRIGTLAANKYVIVDRISKGGMGAVYRALQMPVEREIAFKVLRTEMEDSDKGRDRFVREARAISRLTHPNIITLHDFGFEASGHPYMVMEYAPGDDLGRWVHQEGLTTARIVRVIEQLLAALAQAHREGIVHRDLKPENMIVTRTGTGEDFVKLLDFGIARLINESTTKGLTREGEVFGTPHYMAPEQAQGSKEVGPQADIYAVGIILYEMLTGQPPFDADAPLAVLMMHLNDPLPPIEPRAGLELPAALRQVIERACDKNAQARYDDAEQMLQALRGVSRPAAAGASASPQLPAGPAPSDIHARPTTLDVAPDAEGTGAPPVHLQTGSFGSSSSGVAVEDPDPSEIVRRDSIVASAHPDTDDELYSPPETSSRGKLIVAALLGLFVISGGVGLGWTMLQDQGADTAAAQNPSPDEGDPPAVTEKTDPAPEDTGEPDEPSLDPDAAPGEATALTGNALEADPSAAPGVDGEAPEEESEDPDPAPTAPDPSEEGTEPDSDPGPAPERVAPPRPDPEPTRPEERSPPRSKDTTPKKPPAPEPSDAPDEPSVEAWGAPTAEQKKKGIEEDKW